MRRGSDLGGEVLLLDAALERAPMTTDEAIRVASAVADHVAALHAAGRAHGDVRPGTVALGHDGTASLVGPLAPRTGLAAPVEIRSADLHGAGLVLAAALGQAQGGVLPARVAELVARAERSDAPAAALATALRRLGREPLAADALLLPDAPQRAARAPRSGRTPAIPSADRRRTGTAVAAVIAAAAIGAVLLLVGTPAEQGGSPLAAAEAPAARTSAVPPSDAGGPTEAADAAPRSGRPVVGSSTGRPAAARTPVREVVPPVQRGSSAVLAAPTTRSTAVPGAATTPATSAPPPTAEPTTPPTRTPPPPAPTPVPTAAPTTPTGVPRPTASAAPSAAPTAAPPPAAAEPSATPAG